MYNRSISQEALKLIACATMLLDHIGAVIVPLTGLRIIGRLAFPIYAFLLAEGIRRTRSSGKYFLRLLIGALLAEVPFDFLFFGGLTWNHQSVMVTLLLGAWMLRWHRNKGNMLLPFAVCFLLAEILRTDYGGWGIAMIGLFGVTEELPGKRLWQLAGLGLIFLAMNSFRVYLMGLRVPIQLFGLLAMVPIGFYSGRKCCRSKWVQWGFYLFYPVHMTVLLLIQGIG